MITRRGGYGGRGNERAKTPRGIFSIVYVMVRRRISLLLVYSQPPPSDSIPEDVFWTTCTFAISGYRVESVIPIDFLDSGVISWFFPARVLTVRTCLRPTPFQLVALQSIYCTLPLLRVFYKII